MERLHTDLRACDGAFEQGPEVLNAVRSDVIPDIRLGMVNDLLHVGLVQPPVAAVLIGVEFAAWGDVLAHFLVQRCPLRVREHRRMNPALPRPRAAAL